jgi:hypothetical protein
MAGAGLIAGSVAAIQHGGGAGGFEESFGAGGDPPAMSKVVPWLGLVRRIGRPRVTLTARSKPISFSAM